MDNSGKYCVLKYKFLKNEEAVSSAIMIKARKNYHYFVHLSYKGKKYNTSFKQSNGLNGKKRPYKAALHCS